jgi:hypothetical protein
VFTQTSSVFRGDSEALGEASREMGGFGLTYNLYASIQFDAIACCAALRSICSLQTNSWSSPSSRSLTCSLQGEVRWDSGQRFLIELEPHEFEWNQVINLVIAGAVRGDAVFSVNFAFHFRRNVTYFLVLSTHTESCTVTSKVLPGVRFESGRIGVGCWARTTGLLVFSDSEIFGSGPNWRLRMDCA